MSHLPGTVALKRAVARPSGLVTRMSFDSIVQPLSALCHFTVAAKSCAASGSRNICGNSTRTSSEASFNSPASCVSCTAPLNPLAPGVRWTAAKDKSSTRVCSEYFGALSAPSRSNWNETSLRVPVAFSARSRAMASVSGR
jgi:hypothetical protein